MRYFWYSTLILFSFCHFKYFSNTFYSLHIFLHSDEHSKFSTVFPQRFIASPRSFCWNCFSSLLWARFQSEPTVVLASFFNKVIFLYLFSFPPLFSGFNNFDILCARKFKPTSKRSEFCCSYRVYSDFSDFLYFLKYLTFNIF